MGIFGCIPGREPTCPAGRYARATYGNTNPRPSHSRLPATPIFSLVSGVYTSGGQITMSNGMPNATIYRLKRSRRLRPRPATGTAVCKGRTMSCQPRSLLRCSRSLPEPTPRSRLSPFRALRRDPPSRTTPMFPECSLGHLHTPVQLPSHLR
jgi:hypothetical protein